MRPHFSDGPKYRASPFSKGDRVVLVKDWTPVANAGEISGEVIDFKADGRAVIRPEAGVSYVAPNDSYWGLAPALDRSGSLFQG